MTLTPSGTVVGWFEPGSLEWHAARANGVGGSEIAAVMGLSPYESQFSLWHRKAGSIGPAEENPQMYWGKRLEPAIRDEFALRHPEWRVERAPTFHATGRPWHIVNPDGLAYLPDGTVELFEAKSSRDGQGFGEEGTDEVPVHYRTQGLWYEDALKVRRCHLAVLIAGSEYREYVIEYDETEARLLRDAGAKFVQSLAAGIPPRIDGHDATFQAVKDIPDGLDEVDVDVEPLLRDRYFKALEVAKAAEWEKREAAGLLLDAIGTGHRARCLGDTVATRTVRNGRTYSLQPARNRGIAA